MAGRAFLLVLAVALVGLTVGGCTSRDREAMLVLADLGAGAGPSALKRQTAPPRRRAVTYSVEGRDYRGDLYEPGDGYKPGGGYTPGEGPLAALVLVPGVSRAGKNDRRLVAFATTLARARFAVLVPDMVGLRALQVRPSDVREIVDAVTYITSSAAPQAWAETGIVAISYATGPAVLAALDPAVAARVRFVVTIGGYHDIVAVLTFFTTGAFREAADRPWRYRTPNAYGKWVFVMSNTDRLRDPRDRALLKEMARRKLNNLGADIGDLAARLGPEGRSVYALLANRNPDRVPGLIAKLPGPIRADLAALDLKRRDLSRLRARLIIIHGRNDAIIPYTESVALARAVPKGRADLFIVDDLGHVNVRLGDSVTLWRAVRLLLKLRGPAPARRVAGHGSSAPSFQPALGRQ